MKRVLFVLILAARLRAASIEGHVRDANGKPVSGASVRICRERGDVSTFKTDDSGLYRVPSLAEGRYSIWLSSQSEMQIVTLGPQEDKQVDLTTEPRTDTIPFADEPNFVVAGVTDNTNMGSHGSDVTRRSVESLSQATGALKEGNPAQSQDTLRAALKQHPSNASLHHALADSEEASGRPLDAVLEYQRAAALQPSESNVFDWGTELLTHGAPEAAEQVFAKFQPKSSRLLIGLGVSLFSQGKYAAAGQAFFSATDVQQMDPDPYLVLAKAAIPEITGTSGYLDRMARFAVLHPTNALANYYYGLALLDRDKRAAEASLRKAVQLDPSLGEASLRLGILSAEGGDYPAALGYYQAAVKAQPNLAQAHYRLAAAYRKKGDSEAARRETEIFRNLESHETQERNEQRLQLQRFVITFKTPAGHQ